VVVIDPGHGGRDPGAVSADQSLKEKDLTLAVAGKVKTILEKENPRVRVVLTRNDDSFISLSERTSFANAQKADLFISIHYNSAPEGEFKGVETYVFDKAETQREMRSAARENGMDPGELNDAQATLLDLMVTSKMNESTRLAQSIQTASGRAAETRDRGVKQGPFYVLLGARMPAVLVECAFISSPKESIASAPSLERISRGIAAGTLSYLEESGSRHAGALK
jgi:N-acetylmuramoyl-L-alanine amidase